MGEEFTRTGWLLGEKGMERLRETSILVFGVGGVGSHCIEALARCGVGKLILVDNDTVSVTNINRQSIAYHSTVGRYKTEVMRERILDISPKTEVVTYETFVLPENLEDVLKDRPDYMIDAIDTVTAKIAIAQKAQEYGIPLISSMGTGNKLHGEMFEITDISKTSVCPLCKVMRKELKSRGISRLKVLYSKEKPLTVPTEVSEKAAGTGEDVKISGKRRSVPGSVSFVPPVAGLLIAGEVIRDIVLSEGTSAGAKR